MKYAVIKKYDIANGPGIRVSLFVSGCRHKCPGCFNEIAWDFNYGEEFTDETINEIISALSPDHISGLTLLGGEPLEHENQIGLLPLIRKVKEIILSKPNFYTQLFNLFTKIHQENEKILTFFGCTSSQRNVT